MLNNTLIVATYSYAGMGPYATCTINSFNENDNVWFFLVEDERHFFSKNIDKRLMEKTIIYYRSSSKFHRLSDMFFDPCDITSKLLAYVRQKEIKNIEFITMDCELSNTICKLAKKCNVYFSVHDLHPHEAKKAWYKQFRQYRLGIRHDNILKNVNNLITSSKSQFDELKLMFPLKKIYYHETPTLMNDCIINGKKKVAELCDIGKYVLFFGRIEAYKGVELLYKAFQQDDFFKDKKLVIAGPGDIYFQRNEKESNIIWINRYIADEELADLFANAEICVFSHLSVTNSNISQPCYYQVPILACDLPFFKHIETLGLGFNFTTGSHESLAHRLKEMLESDLSTIKETEKKYYNNFFDPQKLRKQFVDIFSNN